MLLNLNWLPDIYINVAIYCWESMALGLFPEPIFSNTYNESITNRKKELVPGRFWDWFTVNVWHRFVFFFRFYHFYFKVTFTETLRASTDVKLYHAAQGAPYWSIWISAYCTSRTSSLMFVKLISRENRISYSDMINVRSPQQSMLR